MIEDDWFRRFEGIVHSYKQHIDTLEVSTERDYGADGSPILRVEYESKRPGYPTASDSAKRMADMYRARLVRRLVKEDDAWMSRLSDDYLVLSGR